jgi:hypothetical protein
MTSTNPFSLDYLLKIMGKKKCQEPILLERGDKVYGSRYRVFSKMAGTARPTKIFASFVALRWEIAIGIQHSALSEMVGDAHPT